MPLTIENYYRWAIKTIEQEVEATADADAAFLIDKYGMVGVLGQGSPFSRQTRRSSDGLHGADAAGSWTECLMRSSTFQIGAKCSTPSNFLVQWSSFPQPMRSPRTEAEVRAPSISVLKRRFH